MQTLPNNTPGFIRHATDLGPVNSSSVITVTVWLKTPNQAQLDQLVKQQYAKGSGQYHQWLTQSQFNAQFAPSSQQVKAVLNYLAAKNLTVLTVAENNFYIKLQGTVAAVQKAFNVQIHSYKFRGASYRSNTGNPSVSSTVGPLIAGITGMDNLGFRPMVSFANSKESSRPAMQPLDLTNKGVFFEGQCFRGVETHTFTGTGESATYTGNRYGADITNGTIGHLPPCGYGAAELQTAYNMNPLYGDGLDGSGETVVITDAFGSATIQQDAQLFAQVNGLPPVDLTVLRAPGAANSPFGPAGNWDLETSLDVEWVHAIAPGAKIVLVIGPTNHSDLDEALNWAVIHHLGNTISNSWSSLEGFGNPVQLDRVNRILEMAAAVGVDINFSSGDCGDNVACVGFKTVDFPGSSPFATSIGGTSLALNADDTIAFQTGWGNNLTRIANRVSEGSTPVIPPLHLGFNGGAGGGTSLTFAKPSFQSSLPGTMRLVPDISMLADPFTGAEFIQTIGGVPEIGVVGGTSLACPMFSAVMAIAAQKNNHVGLGQAARLVYGLPAGAVSDVTAVSSANDVTGSTTNTGGTTNYSAADLAQPLENTTSFYSALYNSPFSTRWFVLTFGTDSSLVTGAGWDNVTGVGTPNGANFVNALVP